MPARALTRREVLGAGLALAAIPCAQGQSASEADRWPQHPVRIVVPTGAGSAPDVLTRKLGEALSARLGQAVVVESKPGAAGMLGADTVARAPGNGYHLLMAWDGMMAINPLLYRKMAYRPLQDFAPVAAVGRVEFALVAHPSFEPDTLAAMIEYAKVRPGKIDYASPGSGEAHHIAMEALKDRAGIDLVHVPYKGGPAALNDVLAGHVSLAFIGLTPALPHLRSGKLKALAVLGQQPSQHLPGVPTVAQTLPGFDVEGSWLAFFAPAATPASLVARIADAINREAGRPEFARFLAEQGMTPLPLGPAGLDKLVRDDTARFRAIVEKAGIRVE